MTDAKKKAGSPPAQAAAQGRRRELKDIDFTQIRRELEGVKSRVGVNLYDHLKKVFEFMILHDPAKAIDRFEEVSYMIKEGIDISNFLKCEDIRNYKPNVLCNGRTGHMPPEEPTDLPEGEEFDPEEAKRQMESADPYEPLLKCITDDTAISMGQKFKQACWSVRLCGDKTEYKNENPAIKEARSNAVVVVRNYHWPGAYSFFYDGKVQQIYLGSGHKFTQKCSNFPENPPHVMEDPEEYEVGPEPTPLEEPVKVEEKPEGEEGNEEEDDD